MGILKAAEYRSAANYLEAAKRKHIESGLALTDKLRQACRMAIRSAKRDLGPPKQAEPIPLASMAAVRVREAFGTDGPMAPGRSCLLAAWWLLREIEASHCKVSHVSLDWSKKRADLKLPNSKTDLMALGTSRAHSCSCAVSEEHQCPFHMIAAQVAFADIRCRATQKSGYSLPSKGENRASKDGCAPSLR